MKLDLFGRVMLTLALVAMLVAVARAAFGEETDRGGGPSLARRSSAGAEAADPPVTPSQAIERAVAQRLGGDLSIAVTALDTSVAAEPGLAALPEPGGRPGQPMRFVLTVGGARRGVATATVAVTGNYARAARAIARSEVVAGDAIEVVHATLPPVELKRLPAAGEAIGLIARRDIAAGEPLTEAVLQFPPLVRSGDVVAVTVRVGVVEVSSAGTASGSGHEGDIIRVRPRHGGRPMKARITGRAAVEIVQ